MTALRRPYSGELTAAITRAVSAGTSSRETFICGVLIVSNTVIIQLAVVSLIEPLKAPRLLQGTEVADDYLDPALKRVPALPGLPRRRPGLP